MKRKLFSVLLTAALLLSATVPAFADDDESASSANDTSSGAEFSASASEEGPVEDETTFDAPSAVEGFTADDGADTDDMVSDTDTDTPDENAVDDADEIVVLDGVIEPEETETENAPETAEDPVEEDVSENVDEPATEDAPETAEETVAEDAPEAVDEPVTENALETAEETVAEDAPETANEPAEEDAPETANEPAEEDAPEAVEEPVTENAPEAVEIPVTRSVSGGGFHSAMAGEPVAKSAPKTVSELVEAEAPETVSEPVTANAAGGAMSVSAVPLLPDEAEADEEELFATLFGEAPIISVEVPDTGSIIINPYRLKVQQGSDTTQDEIISDVTVLASRSNVALSVQASAIGWAEDSSSAVRFVDDANDMQNKDLFVYYEFQNASDQSGDVRWSGSYSGASNQLVVRNGANAAPELSEVLTIPAADDDSPTYAALRAFGSASVPDAGSWKKTDTVNIRVAFTFIPV